MQSGKIEIPEAVSIFQNAIGRIECMEVLYDKLYRTGSYKTVFIGDYLSKLIDRILKIFPDVRKIKIGKQIDNFSIEAKIIFPLGIIINELITNSMKYAFIDRDDGLIQISATKENNHVTVVFKDNGVGMRELMGYEQEKGFGMKLIGMLVDQIDGSYKIENKNGTKYIFEFEI